MVELAQRLRTEDGALAALAACVLIVGLIVGASIYFLFAGASQDGADALTGLARYRAEIAQGPALRESYRSFNRAMQSQPGVAGGGTLSLAEAKLDGDVKVILQASGAQFRSSQILPAGNAHGFETIAIEYDFSAPAEKLESVLYALRNHTPFLLVSDATVTAADEDRAGNPPLHVHFILHAYRWAGHQW